MADKDVVNKVPIYKLRTKDEVMKYYDVWSGVLIIDFHKSITRDLGNPTANRNQSGPSRLDGKR